MELKDPSDTTRPAYILFTSGSTGTPKAVVISQNALIASSAAAGHGMGLDETSRVLQSTRLTFDPSVTEIVATLYHGGCVCIP
ncbi:UNVERIFIED_CONTAM: AMP-binding protein, partial [Bacteroidetes bacterium 56_B9]